MTITTVLIADPGAAAGIIGACRDMGLATVLPADASASLADILAAARDRGADAVHPGTRSLADDPDAARAVLDAGLAWIGAAPETLGRVRDTNRLHGVLADLGMAVWPGPDDPIESNLRRIDIPVFGFGDGTGVHLFERDASVRAGNRAVIVETPVPTVAPAARDAMRDAARALAGAVGLRGAATAAFVLDRDTGTPGFLGFHARLDADYRCTEMITGIDLVGSQIEAAMGTLSAVDQAEIEAHGAALTCRVLAGRADTDFTPADRETTTLALPGDLDQLRVDAVRAPGDTLGPGDDPLLAELTVRALDRGTAVDSMTTVLAHVRTGLTADNVEELDRILRDPVFRLALPTTAYLRAGSFRDVVSGAQ